MPADVLLGSNAGAAMRFRNGLLAAIEIARAELTLAIRESLETSPGDISVGRLRVEPMSPGPRAFYESHQATQHLAAGVQRTLQLDNEINAVTGEDRTQGQRSEIKAQLTVELPKAAPGTWQLSIDDVIHWQAKGKSLDITLANGVELALAANGEGTRLEVAATADGGIEAKVAPGPLGGTAELSLRCTGLTPTADTAVLCWPEQWREAAIALAAVPDRRYVPLIVVPQLTVSKEEHLALYRTHRSMVDATLERAGTISMRDMAEDETQRADLAAESAQSRRLIEALAQRRSIAKRNLMLRHALADLGIRRAILLFEPEDELDIVAPEAPEGDALPAARPQVLSERVERVILLPDQGAGTLEAFAQRCAMELGGDAAARGWVHAASNSAVDVLAALHEARLAGALLQIPETPPGPPKVRSTGPEPSENHAVLVEARNDASSLVGAVYAAHLGTRLVVTPPPRLGAVREAIAEMQRHAQKDDRPSANTTASGPFRWLGTAVRRTFFKGARADTLSSLEDAVSAAVPAEACRAVGKARLTAFTTGLPYGFVSFEGQSWAEKPIGHVIEDADLQLLSDFAAQATLDPLASFNLVMGSGLLQRSGTEEIGTSLTGRLSDTLVVRSDSEPIDPASINDLLNTLPVDFVFFNTPRSYDGIHLGPYELRASAIPQWSELYRRPIVLNNSSLSWTNMSRQFVRIGARAYATTLWDVDAYDAAKIGASLITRLARGGQPLSEMLARGGQETARAYIGIGTALARYAGRAGDRAAGSSTAAVAQLERMLTAVRIARSTIEDGGMAARFYKAYLEARRALAAERAFECGLALAELIWCELEEFREKRRWFNPSPKFLLDVVADGEALLAAAELPAERTNPWRLRLLHSRGMLRYAVGAFADAEADLLACLDDASLDPWLQRTVERVLVDRMISSGRWSEALPIAQRMREEARASENTYGEMLACGRIAQIMKRLRGRHEEGISAALEGERLAVAHGDPVEQSSFAVDLSALYLLAKQFDKAVEAAERALRYANLAQSEMSELSAFGTLGQAYFYAGDYGKARHYAERGLQRAIELDLPQRINAFRGDLATLDEREGIAPADNLAEDLDALEQSGSAIPAVTRAEHLGDLMARSARSGDPELIGRATITLPAQLSTDRDVADRILFALGEQLLIAVRDLPAEQAFKFLLVVNNTASSLIDDKADDRSFSVVTRLGYFAQYATVALGEALRGDREEALTAAAEVDELMGDTTMTEAVNFFLKRSAQ